jgi:hypothetical protein
MTGWPDILTGEGDLFYDKEVHLVMEDLSLQKILKLDTHSEKL